MKTAFLIIILRVLPFFVESNQLDVPYEPWKLFPIGRVDPRNNLIKGKTYSIEDEEKLMAKLYLNQKMSNPRQDINTMMTNFQRNENIPDTKNESLQSYTYLECNAAVRRWYRDIEKGEYYALRMIDSFGTRESGFFEGNWRSPGHYQGCKVAKNNDFSGKYCVAYYGIYFFPNPPGLPIDFTRGLCFPSVCSDEEIGYIYRRDFYNNTFPPLLLVRCTQEQQFTTIDIICSIVLGLLAILILSGTFLEGILNYFTEYDQNSEFFSKAMKFKQRLSIKLLLCFSIISNTKSIIDMKKKPGMIPVLDGIRFISTTWVILGHVIQGMMYNFDNSVQARREVLSNPAYMVVINAFYSVDTFFFLSGLLVAYLGMKELDKSNGFLNIPLMYLQRWLRLTPLYAFCILFHMSLYKFLGYGPAWKDFPNYNYDSCKDVWWTNLIYINNLYPLSNTCYAVGWYLGNDMQFYLLSPVFLLLFYHWPLIGIPFSLSAIFGSTVYNGITSANYSQQPTVIGLIQQLSFFYRYYILGLITGQYGDYTYQNKLATDTYNLPWFRIHVYIIGMLTGYILYKTKGKIRMHWILVVLGWVFSAGFALAILYGPYVYVKTLESMPVELSAFYNSVSRPVYGFCLTWVVIACCSGYGGIATKFLDWKIFQPLSRLTYSTYLVHIYVLYYYVNVQDNPLHFDITYFIIIFFGVTMLSFMFGFVCSVMIEWPFSRVFKTLFAVGQHDINNKAKSIPHTKDHVENSSETVTSPDYVTEEEKSSLDSQEIKSDCNYENKSFCNESSF